MSDCNHENTSVYDSRKYVDYISRRRHCKDCGKKYSTVEVVVENTIRGARLIENLKGKYGLNSQQQRAINLLVESFK